MILVVIACLLFLFVGTTGKIVRSTLMYAICNAVVYFGLPAFAMFMLYLRWK